VALFWAKPYLCTKNQHFQMRAGKVYKLCILSSPDELCLYLAHTNSDFERQKTKRSDELCFPSSLSPALSAHHNTPLPVFSFAAVPQEGPVVLVWGAWGETLPLLSSSTPSMQALLHWNGDSGCQ
jgi:hypothetical protein